MLKLQESRHTTYKTAFYCDVSKNWFLKINLLDETLLGSFLQITKCH